MNLLFFARPMVGFRGVFRNLSRATPPSIFSFQGGGAQQPLGPKHLLRLKDFTGPGWVGGWGGGVSPVDPPLNTPLVGFSLGWTIIIKCLF